MDSTPQWMRTVQQLVAQGRSRLTARRIVEIERDEAEVSRARRHPASGR